MSTRPTTLKDVADLAGVHVSTASRALDPRHSNRISAETLLRVHEAASRLGYIPDLVAAGLKRGTTMTVGVVLSDFEDPYNGALTRGISSVLEERGFIALFAETVESSERIARIVRHLVSRRVDAIITTAAHLGDTETLMDVTRSDLPLVLATRDLPGSGLPSVLHDDEHGGALAAAHLLELGHRHLAQIRGPMDIETFSRRGRGYAERIAAAGAVDLTTEHHASAVTIEEGRRLMQILLAPGSQAPTGVFAHTDLMAIGALEALKEAGLRCPADVSIVGYDDVPLAAHLAPALTTVRIPGEELGREAGRLALELIDEPKAPARHLRVPATLVARESTAPPAADG